MSLHPQRLLGLWSPRQPPSTPPLLLSPVTKICAQCEMEHSADGLMEQMCSSDFGECGAHAATPSPSSETHTHTREHICSHPSLGALAVRLTDPPGKCTSSSTSSRGLRTTAHRPQTPSLARFLQPSPGTCARGATEEPPGLGSCGGRAGLAPRWMGAAGGERWSSFVPGHLCRAPHMLWPGDLWSPAPQLHPGAPLSLGQPSQVWWGPGSCMDHTAQLVIFAKSAPVLCLGLPVCKRGRPMESLLQQVFHVAGLFGVRCVCAPERENERR